MLGHVLSPVRFLPRHSFFADCKLYIRTRLLASASSNFWKLSPLRLSSSDGAPVVLEERLSDYIVYFISEAKMEFTEINPPLLV